MSTNLQRSDNSFTKQVSELRDNAFDFFLKAFNNKSSLPHDASVVINVNEAYVNTKLHST